MGGDGGGDAREEGEVWRPREGEVGGGLEREGEGRGQLGFRAPPLLGHLRPAHKGCTTLG